MQETLNSFLIRLMAFHKTGTGQPPLGNWPVWGHHFTAHGMTRIGTSRIHSGAKTQGLRFGDCLLYTSPAACQSQSQGRQRHAAPEGHQTQGQGQPILQNHRLGHRPETGQQRQHLNYGHGEKHREIQAVEAVAGCLLYTSRCV